MDDITIWVLLAIAILCVFLMNCKTKNKKDKIVDGDNNSCTPGENMCT